MIKTLCTLLLLSYSTLSFASTLPTDVQKFTPDQWEVISKANGDLNTDGQSDIALLIQPKNIKKHNRKLLILFQYNQNYRLYLSKKIPAWTYHDDPEQCLDDAFDESSLKIKNQLLNLTFNEQPNCTNTFDNIYTYRFKLVKNQLKLIGFDALLLDKISGQQNEVSLNFFTHKAKLISNKNIFEAKYF